jgi:predicted dehydrogenase
LPVTTRWGIAGTGIMAEKFVRGLADAPGAKLAAVASRTLDRAKAFAGRFGVPRAHGSYEALAGDPSVDIAYIASYNTEHRPSALALLRGGKPIVVEKPFALDAAETREIIALARERRLFCMEGMWTRFLPAVRELVARVGEGAIGEVRMATLELGHPAVFDPVHRLFSPALGGGALLDLGVYPVSLAILLFGAPTAVRAQATFAPSGVDEQVAALLTHTGGRQSVIAASLRSRLSNGATVAGTTGFARLYEPLYRPERLSFTPVPNLDFRYVKPAADHPGRLGATLARVRGAVDRVRGAAPPWLPLGGRSVLRRVPGNGYQFEALEAMRCVQAGLLESPIVPLEETLRVAETLDAIRAAWA